MRSPETPFSAPSGVVVLLIASLFALWGLGHWLYQALLPPFVATFALSGVPLTMTQSAHSVVYFFGALPAAFLARRLSSKAAILIGLGAIAIGALMFYPAAVTRLYGYFLFAVAIMAAGWIILEVTANPLAANLGGPQHFVQHLNLAQSFYPVGALGGMAIGQWLLTHQRAIPGSNEALAIAHPYILLGAGVVVLAFLFEGVRLPPLPHERVRLRSTGTTAALLRQPLFLFAILAQAFSVTALVGTWSADALSFFNALPGRPSGFFGNGLTWVLIAFAIGRFTGSLLMRRIAPVLVLAGFATCGVVCCLIAAASGGLTAALAVIVSAFCLSITWPTILGLGIEHTGAMMKPATALIAMGGAAGGVLHQTITGLWPPASAQFGLLLPAFSFAVIGGFALLTWHKRISHAAA